MEAAVKKGITSVGHLDIEGGGMVDVQGTLAVIGHMEPPFATSIIDRNKGLDILKLSRPGKGKP